MDRAIDVFFVSKPLVEPFDDSGKLLPYLIATRLPQFRFYVPVTKEARLEVSNIVAMPVFGSARGYTVGLGGKISLFFKALSNETADILHFFFSPNPMGNRFGRLLTKLKKGVRTVQTVMSLPRTRQELVGALFADVVVVWSRLGKEWAEAAAQEMPPESRPKIVHIPPGIVPLKPLHPDVKRTIRGDLGYPPEDFLVVYPGDVEFTDASIVTAQAAKVFLEQIPASLVMAMRPKTSKGDARLDEIREILSPELASGKVRIEGSIPYFQDLISVADLVVLPAEHTYAKTDIPLAVLEAMSAGVPAVVGSTSAMKELVDEGVAIGVEPQDPDALAQKVIELYTNNEELARLREVVPKYVLQRHTADTMAEGFAEVYEALVKKGRLVG